MVYSNDSNNVFFSETTPVLLLLIFLLLFFIYIVAYWKLFVKAGESGWKSLIPIYNAYIFFKIVYGKGWYFLLLLIPFVNFVVYINATLDLARAYGKSLLFGVGLVFLSPIFILILAFGKSEYRGVKQYYTNLQ